MFGRRRFSVPWELLVYLAPLPLLVGSLFVGPSENVRPADVLHWFHTQILSSGAAGAGL